MKVEEMVGEAWLAGGDGGPTSSAWTRPVDVQMDREWGKAVKGF